MNPIAHHRLIEDTTLTPCQVQVASPDGTEVHVRLDSHTLGPIAELVISRAHARALAARLLDAAEPSESTDPLMTLVDLEDHLLEYADTLAENGHADIATELRTRITR